MTTAGDEASAPSASSAPSGGSTPGGQAVALALVTLVGLGLRALTLPGHPSTYDEVDFTLALESFDLARHQPHFPGYPVFVLVACGLRALGLSSAVALGLPGIVGQLLVAGVLLVAGRRSAHPWLAPALWLLAPLPILESGRAMSDSFALGFAALGWLGLASRQGRHRNLGALALGLMVGIKADHALLLAPLLLPEHRRIERWGAALAGLVVWLLPLLQLVGPGALCEEGRVFLRGHMTDWGGAVTSSDGPGVPARALRLLAGVGAGLGLPTGLAASLGGPLLLSLSASGWLRWSRREAGETSGDHSGLRVLAVGVPPMTAWILLGQNLAHPRHLLALLPIVLLGLGALEARRVALAMAIGLALAGVFQVAPELGREATHPSRLALRRFIEAGPDELRAPATRIFGGEVIRVLEPAGLRCSLRRARTRADLIEQQLADPVPPERVFVTNEVQGLDPAELGPAVFDDGVLVLREWLRPSPEPALPLPEEAGR